jgi:hypothetical protein
MGTCLKKGLILGLLGMAIDVFEISSVWGQGVSGSPPVYPGRLVINYPLLNAILLILLLIAVGVAVRILNRLFITKLKAFENRIAYLEYTVKDLYARQKEDLDGLLRQIHNLPGKAKTSEPKKDPERDTTVGKSPIPREPNPSAD